MNVKQTQKIDPNNEYPQVEFFQTKVDIEIDNKIEQVWIKPQAENIFTFDAPTKPKLVNFDYEGTLIKELKFDKSNDELAYQANNDKDVLGRVWAMNQLSTRFKSKDTSDADKAKLLTILNQKITNDSLWLIRRDAIRIFAPQGQGNQFGPAQANPNPNQSAPMLDPTTIATLTTATKDKNPLVRAAAIDVLGSLKSEKYADIFLAALNDQSYAVIDSASGALANTKSAKAYDALSKLLDSASWKDRIRLAGLRSLASLGDKRALDFGFKYADKSYPANVRATALNIVAATGKDDTRSFPLMLESFKTALEAGNFQGVSSGLRGFIQLADPRAQQAFDMAKEKYKSQQNFLGFVNNLETQFKKAVNK